MTTSCRLRRRSTAARSAARSAFSPAGSPTEASSTTYTVRPSPASARRSSSVRWLLPLDGSPQNTTSGILPGATHVRTVESTSGVNRK
ncbi:hypothetical protein LEMLEM_LOCUS4981 [Lemmus lemmus]